MEKGKSIDIELTYEDLRMNLQRLRQEIQETRERRIEVEISTTVIQAANAAPDEDLAVKMARHAIVNEEIVVAQKENDVFNNDITMMLWKLHGKYSFFNQEAIVNGPEGTGPKVVEEEPEEEIVYRPPFQGRWKEGNEKITLEAYL
uniref:Uncharacterized protein n=1 Tax=Solanum tuberosum TaxID=4113 RepID=M1CTQ8_SOLTU